MRKLLLLAVIALASSSAYAEGLLVQRVTVEISGAEAATVRDANVSGEWLESWKKGERRDVTLQPVNDDGRKNGPPRTFHGCALRELSGVDATKGSNVVSALRLACSS